MQCPSHPSLSLIPSHHSEFLECPDPECNNLIHLCNLTKLDIETIYKELFLSLLKIDKDFYFEAKELIEVSHSWFYKTPADCMSYSMTCINSALLGYLHNDNVADTIKSAINSFINSLDDPKILELSINLQTWEMK